MVVESGRPGSTVVEAGKGDTSDSTNAVEEDSDEKIEVDPCGHISVLLGGSLLTFHARKLYSAITGSSNHDLFVSVCWYRRKDMERMKCGSSGERGASGRALTYTVLWGL